VAIQYHGDTDTYYVSPCRQHVRPQCCTTLEKKCFLSGYEPFVIHVLVISLIASPQEKGTDDVMVCKWRKFSSFRQRLLVIATSLFLQLCPDFCIVVYCQIKKGAGKTMCNWRRDLCSVMQKKKKMMNSVRQTEVTKRTGEGE